ncbi:unnamed protein product [Polarella glacialis]|uniref:Uncharacterized protein n=1 Tax=Polarella glacialis TaxID=89957 RepID=A0A813FKD3_POLGL|nr:unnamed protein product [Polarella glacialis]
MAANLDEASRKRMIMSPYPYFTNAEGLFGLECGLRTGLPGFAVMKCNPQVMFGMIQPHEHPTQCYVRNFCSEMTPPPPGDPQKNPYTTLSYELRKGFQLTQGLVYRHNYPKLVERRRLGEGGGPPSRVSLLGEFHYLWLAGAKALAGSSTASSHPEGTPGGRKTFPESMRSICSALPRAICDQALQSVNLRQCALFPTLSAQTDWERPPQSLRLVICKRRRHGFLEKETAEGGRRLGGRCSNDLKDAIQKAEEMGMDVLPARQQYAELAKLERQSPDRAQEMLRWALSTQDGVVLLNVIQEVSVINPQSTGLRPARRKLVEFQALCSTDFVPRAGNFTGHLTGMVFAREAVQMPSFGCRSW